MARAVSVYVYEQDKKLEPTPTWIEYDQHDPPKQSSINHQYKYCMFNMCQFSRL